MKLVNKGGDNTTGAGDGDDEVIMIDLSRVPANVNNLGKLNGKKEKNVEGVREVENRK